MTGRRTAWLLILLWSQAWTEASAQSVRDVFRQVNASVVVVGTVQKSLSPGPGGGMATVPALGSGVLISADGKVITAAHVVQTADRIAVQFLDGQIIPARVIASAPAADVALLQLERVPADATPARLGDSDTVEVGDQIVVIGAPFGLSHTLTVGHVSARHRLRRVIGQFAPLELLQTDAVVNVGNSGGPMFNASGEVIGIVSSILSQSGSYQGGLGVTAKTARQVLLDQPSFWAGIDSYLLQGELAEAFNLPQPVGALVQRVAEGSPAALLGLRAGTVRVTVQNEVVLVGGDVILEVEGIPIGVPDFADKIQFRLNRLQPGAGIAVTVLRAGKVMVFSTTLPSR